MSNDNGYYQEHEDTTRWKETLDDLKVMRLRAEKAEKERDEARNIVSAINEHFGQDPWPEAAEQVLPTVKGFDEMTKYTRDWLLAGEEVLRDLARPMFENGLKKVPDYERATSRLVSLMMSMPPRSITDLSVNLGKLTDRIASLEKERDDAINALEKERTQHEVTNKFYNVVTRERDYERARYDRVEQERDNARSDVDTLAARDSSYWFKHCNAEREVEKLRSKLELSQGEAEANQGLADYVINRLMEARSQAELLGNLLDDMRESLFKSQSEVEKLKDCHSETRCGACTTCWAKANDEDNTRMSMRIDNLIKENHRLIQNGAEMPGGIHKQDVRRAQVEVAILSGSLRSSLERQRDLTTNACVAAIKHSQQTTDQCRAEVKAAGEASPLVMEDK